MSPSMHARRPVALPLFALFLLCACDSDRSSARIGTARTPDTTSPIHLDETLRIEFAAELDPASLTAGAATLVALDGPRAGDAAGGTFRVRGNTLEFVPALPTTAPAPLHGGLLPDTSYRLTVAGDGLKSRDGRPVAPMTTLWTTRSGTTIGELFRSRLAGGPRVVDAQVAPLDDEGAWALGRAFAPPTLTLTFDQPLDPDPTNLPRTSTAAAPGPIELRYDDPEYGAETLVPCEVVFVSSTSERAVVQVRPYGVLPSHAELRLRIAPELRDLHGESNEGAFAEPVRAFSCEADDDERRDALRFEFDAEVLATAHDFAEPMAVVADGALLIPDDFPAVAADVGDWTPLEIETTLRTDSQTLHYQNGNSRTFVGGVLHVRDLHVPAGFVVRAVGPNPLVIVVDGDARIEGRLSADGGTGPQIDYGGQYRGPGDVAPPSPTPGEPWQQPPPAASQPGCAGGAGASAGQGLRWLPPAAGANAPGAVDAGGSPGTNGIGVGDKAGGGGGGAAATAGDPWYPTAMGAGGTFRQRAGHGAIGMPGQNPGGDAGRTWFTNADPGDDFWGRAFVPLFGRERTGELAAPLGGSGGATGGNWQAQSSQSWPGFTLAAGGGGAGGGVIVLQVRRQLVVAAGARISADGGNGRGDMYTEQNFPFYPVGGGGGGAGGTVVLMAGRGIELHVQGGTLAENDYDFCVSADGGIGATSSNRNTPEIVSKYPPNGQPTPPATAFEQLGLGGFGGMGLVQLMVPVGRDNLDGTNTVLDDEITIVKDGVPLSGLDKQRYLGWRGFPDENDVLVDDFGQPTDTIGGTGDIRPDPVLLPVPFAAGERARARSRWLPLGARHRRALSAPDGLPRGVVGQATTFLRHARADGWLPHRDGSPSPQLGGEPLLPQPAAIAAVRRDETTLATPALVVELAEALPNPAAGAYTGFVANFSLPAGGSTHVRSVRHSEGRRLFFVDEAVLAEVTHVQLHVFHAELAGHAPPCYVAASGEPLPSGNVRIGFAFHRAPHDALATGLDPDRFPQQVGTYLYDLSEPSTRAALRAFGPRAVQWDVLLDGAWRRDGLPSGLPSTHGGSIALRRFFLPVRY